MVSFAYENPCLLLIVSLQNLARLLIWVKKKKKSRKDTDSLKSSLRQPFLEVK